MCLNFLARESLNEGLKRPLSHSLTISLSCSLSLSLLFTQKNLSLFSHKLFLYLTLSNTASLMHTYSLSPSLSLSLSLSHSLTLSYPFSLPLSRSFISTCSADVAIFLSCNSKCVRLVRIGSNFFSQIFFLTKKLTSHFTKTGRVQLQLVERDSNQNE